jgi:hypothetical protein
MQGRALVSYFHFFLGATGDWKRQVVRGDQRDQIPLTLYTLAPLTSFSVPISGFVSRAGRTSLQDCIPL